MNDLLKESMRRRVETKESALRHAIAKLKSRGVIQSMDDAVSLMAQEKLFCIEKEHPDPNVFGVGWVVYSEAGMKQVGERRKVPPNEALSGWKVYVNP
jgi:hypothetical protein